MARWVDITVPWAEQGDAVRALVDAYGEIPGITINLGHYGTDQKISVQDVASAAELTHALGTRGITVLAATTRLDEQLRLGPDPDVP